MVYQWNHKVLENISSEGAAWLVGWLFGKGGVTTYKGNTYLNIYIPNRDRLLLPVFQNLLGFAGAVTRDRRPDKNVDYFRIRLAATGLEDRFRKLGVGTSSPPPLDEIPERLHHHFFRGWVEARGVWGKNRGYWFFYLSSANKKAVEAFRDWTSKIGCTSRRSIYTHDVLKLYITARLDLLRLVRNLYVCDRRYTIPRQRKRAELAVLGLD